MRGIPRFFSSKSRSLICATVFMSTLLFSIPVAADPVSGNVVTYQGRLLANGLPVDATYDFQFELYAEPSGGSKITDSLTVSKPGFAVTDGFFTMELNFGTADDFFDGQKRWLQIGVAPTGQTMTYLPRQPITAAPYASYALNADSAESATTAVSASSATNASYAGYADYADFSNSSDHADSAGYANSAGTATSADNSAKLGGVLASGYIRASGNTSNLSVLNTLNTSQFVARDTSASNSGGSIWAESYSSGPATTLYNNVGVTNGTPAFFNNSYSAWALTLASLTGDDAFSLFHSDPSTLTWAGRFQVTGNGDLNVYKVKSGYDPFTYGNAFFVKLFAANDGGGHLRLYAADTIHNNTVLSSHADPSDVDPQAKSSFADSTVAYPWSFEHRNALLGQGAIVDVAKVMAWAEKKMQAEMGADDGKVFYRYSLPSEQTLDLDEYIDLAIEDAVKDRLQKNPEIEIPLSAGRLPAEAWVQTEIMEEREVEETVDEASVDWDTLAVSKKQVVKRVKRKVGTGRFERHLKDGYSLNTDGKLFRKATEDDIDIDVDDIPMPPDWILNRLPEGRLSQADVRQRIETQLAARTQEISDRAVASSTTSFAIEGPTVELANAAH